MYYARLYYSQIIIASPYFEAIWLTTIRKYIINYAGFTCEIFRVRVCENIKCYVSEQKLVVFKLYVDEH